MARLLAGTLTLTLVLLSLTPLPCSTQEKVEEITIVRDDFGSPNIFATTEEGAVYGMGFAQAEDQLEEVLKQYRRAEGTMAEAFGPEYLRHDYRQRLWMHAAVAKKSYAQLPAKVRALLEAYQAGIKAYMKTHPKEVPAWAPELHPWQIIALSRMIIWGWPEGEAAGELKKIGVEPDPVEPRGSNQWVVTPSRTADGYPLALVDPHLSWYGAFRFYEAHLYGGALQTSGMAIPGLPLSSLGHNAFCSVAMTTGGPDCADVYEEEINPKNPLQYKYDDAWRELTIRKEEIKVKEGDKVVVKTFEIPYSHHGPVVARRGARAYAMKIPYIDEFRLPEQAYLMATAKNLTEMKKALSMFQLMQQNVMVATVEGDIFYLRNGRVPIRPKGYDFSRPVPGNTSKTEWQGIHALDDLASITNPWQGYMQNCNVAPEHMLKFSPLVPHKFAERSYLYNYDLPLHQHAMTLEQLHGNTRLTVEDAIGLAMSTEVFNADVWQAKLVEAVAKAKIDADTMTMYNLIVRWNRRADPNSTGPIAYKFWKDQLGELIQQADRAGQKPPAVPNEQLVAALEAGTKRLLKDWGRLEVKYGEVYRVGREGSKKTWPVGGGSVRGLATPRAISFDRRPDGKTWVGRGGQTSTQVIQLSKPPKSWTLLPLGQSDHPTSKHFDDQAEKLFSAGKMKPTYFLDKEGLAKHTSSKTVLKRNAE